MLRPAPSSVTCGDSFPRPGEAFIRKNDFRTKNVSLIDFCRARTYNSVLVCQILLFGLLLAFRTSIREKAFGAGRSPRQTQTIKIYFPLNMAKRMRRHFLMCNQDKENQ